MKAATKLGLLLSTLGAISCGSGGGGGSDNPPGTDETFITGGMKFLSAAQEVRTITSRDRADFDPKKVEQCSLIIDFLNNLDDNWTLANPYKSLPEGVTSWVQKSTAVSNYYEIEPTKIQDVEVKVQVGAEDKTITCGIPQDWSLLYLKDVDIKFPEVLKDYVSDEFEGFPQAFAKGGLAFGYINLLGYDLRFSWTLAEKEIDEEAVVASIKKSYPFIEGEVYTIFDKLISDSNTYPLEILGFSDSEDVLEINRLFGQTRTFPNVNPGPRLFSPFYDANYFDYDIVDPEESIRANAKSGFSVLVQVEYPSIRPIQCDAASPSSSTSCEFINRKYAYEHVEQLLSTERTDAQACMITYFKGNGLLEAGIVKLICIDQQGDMTLRYNGIHPTITEVIQDLNGMSLRD